jgi:hypothetical protein
MEIKIKNNSPLISTKPMSSLTAAINRCGFISHGRGLFGERVKLKTGK